MNVMRKTAWAALALAVVLHLRARRGARRIPLRNRPRESFYAMVGGRDMAKQAGNAMVAQMASNPALAPYQDVLIDWVQKVFAGGPSTPRWSVSTSRPSRRASCGS